MSASAFLLPKLVLWRQKKHDSTKSVDLRRQGELSSSKKVIKYLKYLDNNFSFNEANVIAYKTGRI
jgi:hypothetical protein